MLGSVLGVPLVGNCFAANVIPEAKQPRNLLLSEGNNDGNAITALIIVVLTIIEGIVIAKYS